MPGAELLRVRGLTVRYPAAARPALAGLDLDVAAGESVAVVGPSGCGKSTLCRALLDLLPPGSECGGHFSWQGRTLETDPAARRRLRGTGLGFVPQDHRHGLDPLRRVGDQVAEVLRRHRPQLDRAAVRAEVAALLREVRLSPWEHAGRYPHQLSGGQRQRLCLAAALAARPRLLLADEPTTALDLIAQREVMSLLRQLVRGRELALVIVSHDRELVSLVADRVVRLPAAGSPPLATPDDDEEGTAVGEPHPCLELRGLTVSVPAPGGPRAVVKGVSLELAAGRTLGLAGESGAGKTTLARALAGWLPVAGGELRLRGVKGLSPAARRRAIQLVSQDPAAALDPRQSALAAVAEAARAAGRDGKTALREAAARLAEVDLAAEDAGRRPAELSGGQRQRVQLARALAAAPRVLVADEPTSSLDPERRDALLRLMRRAQRREGLAMLLISHDLGLLENWCESIAVVHEGVLVELYRPAHVDGPRHPFARDLAAASPARLSHLDGIATTRVGEPETDQQPPANGCPYAPRCGLVQPSCHTALPPLRDLGRGHLLRCPEVDRHVR